MGFFTPPHVYIFLQFLIKKKKKKKNYKNWYTRKQPTHFSMAPSNPNLKKKFFRNLKVLKVCVPKKMAPKSQAKIKPSVP